VRHVSTGALFRAAVAEGSDVGRRVQAYLERGDLVPDDIVAAIVRHEVLAAVRDTGGYLLDGYPRTLAQAHAFDAVLKQQHIGLDRVVFVVVGDERIVQRMSGRWSCPTCKATYHLVNNPPKRPGVCDEDGTALFQRPDDKEETVRERLRQYHQNTVDLIPYYKAQGILRDVNGEGGIEEVYGRIERVLDR